MDLDFQLYQLVAPLIAIYYILSLIKDLKDRRKFIVSSGIWLVFWLVITFLGLAPDPVSERIASLLGFKSNVTATIFLLIGFLIILCFYLSSRVVSLERQVTQLVRNIALDEAEKRDS